EYNELAVWVALQDVNAESGCRQFVSGSHKRPLLEHHSMNDDSSSQALECVGSFDKSAASACPLCIGSCSIHHPGTLHCSSPNLSDKPRYACIMVSAQSRSPLSGRKHFHGWRIVKPQRKSASVNGCGTVECSLPSFADCAAAICRAGIPWSTGLSGLCAPSPRALSADPYVDEWIE